VVVKLSVPFPAYSLIPPLSHPPSTYTTQWESAVSCPVKLGCQTVSGAKNYASHDSCVEEVFIVCSVTN